MYVTAATLRRAHLYPELLPDSGIVTMVATVPTAAQLQLRRFNPQYLRLEDVRQASINAEMRITADDVKHIVNMNAIRTGVFEELKLEVIDYLDFLYMSTPGAANHLFLFSLWVDKLTVAHKLARGARGLTALSQEEQRIAKDYGVLDTVEKGNLPLPIEYQIEREYRPIQEFTRTAQVNLTAGVEVVLDTIQPKPNEAIVLTGFAVAPGLAQANDIHFYISRDDDDDYVDFTCWPVGAFTTDVPCFIPATKQMRLSVQAAQIVAGWTVKYTIRRIRLTNTLQARWGLKTKAELPGDVYDKVQAGIL